MKAPKIALVHADLVFAIVEAIAVGLLLSRLMSLLSSLLLAQGSPDTVSREASGIAPVAGTARSRVIGRNCGITVTSKLSRMAMTIRGEAE